MTRHPPPLTKVTARACLVTVRPADDGVENGGSAVDDGEFVVSGGEAAPLFEVVEGVLDDVAVAVVDGVELGWSPAGAAAFLAVPDLVGGLRDRGLDAAGGQHFPDRAGGVRLVSAEPFRGRSRTAGSLGATRSCPSSEGTMGLSPP